MQVIILFASNLLLLHVQCYMRQLISMEDSFGPHVSEKIEYVYNLKLSSINNDKDRLFLKNRRIGVYPLVEVGPGSFKVEYEKKSPDFLVHKFHKLLELKKKFEGE